MTRQYLTLLRVKHYIKNLLIALPLVFSEQLLSGPAFLKTAIGILAFSFSASIVYIINDINDIENDRNHSVKCRRPIASEAISVKCARGILAGLCVAVLGLNYAAAGKDWRIWLILLLYIASNLAYSTGAKNIALLDVCILVLGYILRIYYGAMLVDTPVSSWLYLTTLAMAAFLGFGKRRNELNARGKKSRQVLQQYAPEFLDKIMYLFLGLTIVFYALWCQDIARVTGKQAILFSVPVMLLICVRYSMDVEGGGDGDPVEVVFADKLLLVLAGIYALMMIYILYKNV